MHQGETGFGLKCFKQHSALNLCCSPKCKSNAIMCGDEDCECYKGHAYCQSITIQKLKLRFDRKGQSLLPLLNTIYESLWRQSKQVNIEMEGMRRIIDSQEIKLSESEKRLYSLLIEKKAEGILPSVVSEAMSSLEKEPEHNISQKVVDVEIELEKKEYQLKKMLEDVRKMVELQWVPSSYNIKIVPSTPPPVPAPLPNNIVKSQLKQIDFSFSPILKHQYLTLTNKKIVRANSDSGLFSVAVCLQPDLLKSNSKRCKVQLKVNKTSFGSLLFGVYQLNHNFNFSDQNIEDKVERGSFTSWKYVHLGTKHGHRKESNNITQYRSNDIVEIEYEKKTERVTVTNITKKTQSITYIMPQSKFSFVHFAICFFSCDDEVEIIKGEAE